MAQTLRTPLIRVVLASLSKSTPPFPYIDYVTRHCAIPIDLTTELFRRPARLAQHLDATVRRGACTSWFLVLLFTAG